jgi:nitroimidazol reductase NimA-like FMN-containing flavoprotein (pyridoxamine 5'-phosphate oxidase superfamily)
MTTMTAQTEASRASDRETSDRETSQALQRQIMRQLRTQHFTVLSTVGADGRPSSAGVSYGVVGPDQELVLYVMTRRHLQKARNIAQNPQVSLVVPLRRRLLWFLPPATIQLHGRAELVEATDEEGRTVFQHFWLGRRILKSYRAMERHGKTRICFLKITPDPLAHSYMVGSNILSLMRHMEAGAGTALLPSMSRE